MIFEEYIKKGIDNLRFALNLDDYIPRYRQELMEQIEHKDEKVIQEAGDLVILVERYGHSQELSHKVSDVIWNKIKSKDWRHSAGKKAIKKHL